MSDKINWLHKVEQYETKRGAQHEAEHKAAREPAPEGLEGRVIAALRTVYDPELPVNIYDLGLIYGLDVDEAEGKVQIRMTLTAPGCPVAQTFPATVEDAVEAVEGVHEARVDLVWEPPWSKDRMSEATRLELGLI
jgi:FeS assembly SUF system protein